MRYSLVELEADREGALGIIPPELLPQDVDGPYQTIWQFCLERFPWLFAELDDVVADLVADDLRARGIAEREQEPVIFVKAPPQMRRGRHLTVGCYTKAVLFATFPANP